MPGRINGSKNRKTLSQETRLRPRAELAKNAPPIDYAASYDSLDVLEKVMRRFYLVQAVAIAKEVAKYRHAQLSAVRLAGDLNATVTDNASLDELLAFGGTGHQPWRKGGHARAVKIKFGSSHQYAEPDPLGDPVQPQDR